MELCDKIILIAIFFVYDGELVGKMLMIDNFTINTIFPKSTHAMCTLFFTINVHALYIKFSL